MSKLELSDNFPLPSHDDWQNLVEKGLRGASFETVMKYTEEGLKRGPLSTANDLPADFAPLPRVSAPLLDGRPWHITAPVCDPDIAFANAQMLEDLKGGASAVRLEIGSDSDSLNLKTKRDWKRLLENVYTDLIPITIAPGHHENLYETLISIAELEKAHINLGMDLHNHAELIQSSLTKVPENWNLITIGASKIHNDGGTDTHELGSFAHETANVFRTLGPENAIRHIVAEFTTHQDAHLNIAKLRAARRIYSRIAEAFGVKTAKLRIHTVTSHRMMQKTDPWTNMLRTMSASFGAIIGGADYVTTHPFTKAMGLADPFGYRIARNMQLMMMEESHLGQVQDAAFGSYFHESLTESLAHDAWKIFQSLEAGDDIIESIKTAIKARDEKDAPILGVTLHPLDKDSSAYREAKLRSHSNKGPQS